ncbi:MAG: hypothetical protein H7Y89_14605 [Steroidobacteraceae bacterium]|nr:hypothetical protein [Steroidobacteraceae bacterium]
MERPRPDNDSTVRSDADRGSDPPSKPHYPKTPAGSDDVRPEAHSEKPKVTPLDDGKKIKEGIVVKET